MLFRLTYSTVSEQTIERDNADEALAYAQEQEREFNQHHHHGEQTTVHVTKVEPKEMKGSDWPTPPNPWPKDPK